MKVLCTTQPGLGHLHSLVPVAQALKAAGHTVAFACARSFCPWVEASGFQSFPVGLDWLEARAEEAFPELVSEAPDPSEWLLTDVFADLAAQQMVPDLLDLCHSWEPDLLVHNEVEFGTSIVAELLAIPETTVSIEFYTPPQIWKSLIGDQLAYLRSAHGLSPREVLTMFYRDLYLTAVPPSLQLPEFTLPPATQALRGMTFDRSGSEALPEWVQRLPHRPTVYATLGTVFNQAPDVFAAIINGLHAEPINLIITVGHNQNLEQFGTLPGNVHLAQYIPQSLLLPHCDLAIIHGGFQTTMSVLSHGLPMLMVPLAATDPQRAKRCAELGAALTICPPGEAFAPMFAGIGLKLAPDVIRDAVRDLLGNPRYRQSAQAIQQEIQSLPGPETAVELMTRLVNERDQARQNQRLDRIAIPPADVCIL